MRVDSVTVEGRTYMSLNAGIHAATKEVDDYVAGSAARAAGPIRDFFLRAYENLRRRHNTKWNRSSGLFGSHDNTGTRLFMRSGRGLKSIKDSIHVAVTPTGLDASISAGDMGIHETGGTIRPRSSKYLAIPTKFALDASGKDRRGGPRNYGGNRTFSRRTKSGALFVFRREGKRIVPLYLLKRSVKINARLGLQDTLERGTPRLVAEVEKAVTR